LSRDYPFPILYFYYLTISLLFLTFLSAVLPQLRQKLEAQFGRSLKEYRHFLDEEMIIVMRQMDSPTQIFPFLYLGSEWNASNLAELQSNG
jgi:hypothetical protein